MDFLNKCSLQLLDVHISGSDLHSDLTLARSAFHLCPCHYLTLPPTRSLLISQVLDQGDGITELDMLEMTADVTAALLYSTGANMLSI